jgi:hypothetical protein
MDESGDQSDEQQAAEKPIGIEEQKTIERQEAEAEAKAEEEVSIKDANGLPATTSEEIIGKAQEREQSKDNTEQNVNHESKPKPSHQSTKLFDQFTKHFQVSKIASGNTNNMLNQIQNQLRQIDKTTTISSKQQIVIKQLVAQVKAMQKQLDKIGSSVSRIKNIPSINKKGASHKRIKKK